MWTWLYALLSLVAGFVLGRRLSRNSKQERVDSLSASRARSDDRCRLTREDVLRMIEENGGPEGLQLAGQNLCAIDLSHSAIRRELDQRGVLHASRVPWYSAETSGVNLKGANLEGAKLWDAQLDQSNLSRANLREAELQGANLQRARLVGARAREANLFRAQLQGAILFEADLTGAIIRDANLEHGELAEAVLDNVNLSGTRILNTYVRKRQLGERLVQEQKNYEDPAEHPMPSKRGRHRQAQSIYRELKNNFYSLGLYEDGSWAYIKERRMERKTKAPWRARQYHGQTHIFGMEELPTYESYPRWHPLTWWFWFKYLWKWLLDWAAELSCGYGEHPWRTVALAAVILAVFPLIFWAIGGVGQYDPTVGHDMPSFDSLDYVIYSAGAFATIGYEGLKPINTAAQIWTAVEAILGISILALLMFTLGNRISRS